MRTSRKWSRPQIRRLLPLVLLMSQVTAHAQPAAEADLTGVWSGGAGTLCYAREALQGEVQRVFWFCENPGEGEAYAFTGRRSGNDPAILEGSISYLPKGTRLLRRQGSLEVVSRSTPLAGGGATVNRIVRQRNGFDGLPAKPLLQHQREGTASQPGIVRTDFGVAEDPLPPPSGEADLTGIWYGDDGGVYYVLHRGPFVTWFGEHPTRGWANVAEGGRRGSTVSLDWLDVPKGGTRGGGHLALEVESSRRMVRTGVSGGFGGRVWTKEAGLRVVQPATLGGATADKALCAFDGDRDAGEGDREFGGNGPEIAVSVALEIEPRFRRSIRANVRFVATETGGDRSTVSGEWTRTVYVAPFARTIEEIVSDAVTEVRFTSDAAGGEFLTTEARRYRNNTSSENAELVADGFGFRTEEPVKVREFAQDEAVSRLFYVGDTGGDDISSDDNCARDTRLQFIEFNPLALRLSD